MKQNQDNKDTIRHPKKELKKLSMKLMEKLKGGNRSKPGSWT